MRAQPQRCIRSHVRGKVGLAVRPVSSRQRSLHGTMLFSNSTATHAACPTRRHLCASLSAREKSCSGCFDGVRLLQLVGARWRRIHYNSRADQQVACDHRRSPSHAWSMSVGMCSKQSSPSPPATPGNCVA